MVPESGALGCQNGSAPWCKKESAPWCQNGMHHGAKRRVHHGAKMGVHHGARMGVQNTNHGARTAFSSVIRSSGFGCSNSGIKSCTSSDNLECERETAGVNCWKYADLSV